MFTVYPLENSEEKKALSLQLEVTKNHSCLDGPEEPNMPMTI